MDAPTPSTDDDRRTAEVAHACARLRADVDDRDALLDLGRLLDILGAGRVRALIVGDLLAREGDDGGFLPRVATVAGADHMQSARVWSRVTQLRPDDPAGHRSLITALRDSGDATGAEAASVTALATFPDDVHILVEHAKNAWQRSELLETISRWERVREVVPGHPAAADRIATAVRVLADQNGDQVPPTPAVWHTSAEIVAILENAVSLGGDCELGLLQRRFGAEPMSLLRFARTRPNSLIAALQANFEGVGTPNQTRMEARDGQYFTEDLNYNFVSHTGIYLRQGAAERHFGQVCRRQRKLRQILLNQLETAAKLFVYADEALDDEQISKIACALADIGPVTALLIRLAREGETSGGVELVAPGIFVGTLPEFGDSKLGDGLKTRDLWVGMIRAAYAGFVAGQTAVAA